MRPDSGVGMQRHLVKILDAWGTRMKFSVSAYLWFLFMLAVLATLQRDRIGLFLVPPFLTTLTILHLLPESPIAQPYPVIVGSTVSAGIGTVMAMLSRSTWAIVGATGLAFIVIHLLRAYHPPAVALSLYPSLLHPSVWFPLRVVLPFMIVAVVSAAALCRVLPGWPRYPVPLHAKRISPEIAERL